MEQILKYNKYPKETISMVLKEFQTQIGEPFSPSRMRQGQAVDLFYKLTGRKIAIGGIINFLTRAKDPEAYKIKKKSYVESVKKSIDSSSSFYKTIGEKKFILVPSHGDAASFDTLDEVKKAIEECSSVNITMIKFKLLELRTVKVQAVVSCEIG